MNFELKTLSLSDLATTFCNTHQLLECWLIQVALKGEIAESFPDRLLVILHFNWFRVSGIVSHRFGSYHGNPIEAR